MWPSFYLEATHAPLVHDLFYSRNKQYFGPVSFVEQIGRIWLFTKEVEVLAQLELGYSSTESCDS